MNPQQPVPPWQAPPPPPWTAPPQTDWLARLHMLLDYLRQSGGVQNAGLGGTR